MKHSKNSYTYSYIYKLTLKDQSTYVGLRHCNCLPEEDPYLGSGSHYEKENVIKKEILIFGDFDDKTLALLETIAIMDDKSENPKNVNVRLGAFAYNQFCLSRYNDEVRKKMSEKAKARWLRKDQREYLEGCRKKQMTIERKDQIRKTVLKTTHTDGWSETHSEVIKKVFEEKRKDPEWVKREVERRKLVGLKLRGKSITRTQKVLEFYDFKKKMYNQNKDIFKNWNEFQTFIKGCKTEQEIISILKTVKR